ncbi:MAG TPA: succinate dehydrogenase cytochrome b subunit [Kofleriaceae bacterium]|nr:succinate dehydrogenase cytochrome b subunit [Kofleriaceae bacterium]
MSWFISYVRSSIGAKHIMAVTGLAMLLFVIVHMVGHLGMFQGRDHYNSYAALLQGLGGLKWAIRIGLILVLAAHIASAVWLVRTNAAARPQKYAVQRYVRTNLAARTMALTGLVIFAFIVYHLLHFTFGVIQPQYFHLPDAKDRHDAYTMFVMGFRNTPILISYLVAVALLCVHLAHGASSWLQSLGLKHPKYDRFLEKLGPVLAVILIVGYFAPPLAVAFHVINL